jgi:acetyl-CoA carboxylase carboxyl transferase subunit alpha
MRAKRGPVGARPDDLRSKDRSQLYVLKMLRDTYAKLTPWQKTQVARHPERPHFKIMSRPDRGFHAAGRRPRLCRRPAIIGGLGRFRGRR